MVLRPVASYRWTAIFGIIAVLSWIVFALRLGVMGWGFVIGPICLTALTAIYYLRERQR